MGEVGEHRVAQAVDQQGILVVNLVNLFMAPDVGKEAYVVEEMPPGSDN